MGRLASDVVARLPAHWLNGPLGDLLNRSVPPVAMMGTPQAERSSVEIRMGDPGAPTVLAFGGMAHGLMMPVAEFTRVLDGRDVTVLFVKDLRQCWYQRGLRGIGRTPHEAARALRQLVPPDSTLRGTIGMSSGGTGAILFGALLGAPHVLAFSPRTFIDRQTIRLKRSEGTPVPSFRVNPSTCDMRRALTEHPVPDVQVHVGARNAADMAEADRLRGLPGVTITEHPIAEHTTATYLRDQGLLRDVIVASLGLGPPPAVR